MARVLVASALVAASVGVAHAGGTRKVHVESDPPGATVYLNDPGDGALCTTPCDIDAPLGKTVIILQREGFEPDFDTLVVNRGSKKMTAKFTLQSAVGSLVVKNAPDGSTVQVDEKDAGKTPDKLDIESGSHHIVVSFKGKKLFDDFVNVDTGGDTEIVAKASAIEDSGATGGGGGGDGDGSGDGSDIHEDIHKTTPSGPRKRFITGGVQVDVGFRRFSYVKPRGTLGADSGESEDGEVVAGPAIEVWPAELFGLDMLHNLSLFVRVQFGLNHQVLTTTDMTGMVVPAGAQTAWSSLEASIRNKWVVGDTLAIEASGGFVRDVLGFDTDNEMVHKTVPDTDYRSLRLGARLSLVGTVSPYIEGENRIVLSGGYLATQFMNASATGLHGAAGLAIHMGALEARAEGEITSYSWTFASSDPNADGASDEVFGFAALLGYTY
jgi:hypothetical protein